MRASSSPNLARSRVRNPFRFRKFGDPPARPTDFSGRVPSAWIAINHHLCRPHVTEHNAFRRGFVSCFVPDANPQVRIMSEEEGLWADWSALGLDYWDSMNLDRTLLNHRGHTIRVRCNER